MPPPLEAETFEDRARETPEVVETGSFLSGLTLQDRKQHFRRSFVKKVEPLSHLSKPDLCNASPEFESEIVEAYLSYTTFTVKVWVNYDTSTKKFYIDTRHHDCGKLILSPDRYDFLASQEPDNLELSRVTFELGTPFTTLCSMRLRVSPSKLSVAGRITAAIEYAPGVEHADHPDLFDFVEDVGREIESLSLLYGQDGLQLENLEQAAAIFSRWPTQHERAEKCRYYYDGPWMDISDPNEGNDGWVDFEAKGKRYGMRW